MRSVRKLYFCFLFNLRRMMYFFTMTGTSLVFENVFYNCWEFEPTAVIIGIITVIIGIISYNRDYNRYNWDYNSYNWDYNIYYIYWVLCSACQSLFLTINVKGKIMHFPKNLKRTVGICMLPFFRHVGGFLRHWWHGEIILFHHLFQGIIAAPSMSLSSSHWPSTSSIPEQVVVKETV